VEKSKDEEGGKERSLEIGKGRAQTGAKEGWKGWDYRVKDD
jgi:hypothetical protein